MITRLPLRQFRRRPECPVVEAWLKGLAFPRRLGGDFFFGSPRVHEAWVCTLADGETVLAHLTFGEPVKPHSAAWVLVLGETVLPLKARFSSGWMAGASLAVAVLVDDLGPELARRVAYGEVTRAELEAELILRSLGGLS